MGSLAFRLTYNRNGVKGYKRSNSFYKLVCEKNKLMSQGYTECRITEEPTPEEPETRRGRVPIICVETGKVYATIKEAGQDTGVCTKTISKVLHNRGYYTAGGYHWKTIEE